MRFLSVKVRNYKSILNTEELVLSPGFNTVIGENNVGKTALLEAISVHAERPYGHVSKATKPYPSAYIEEWSMIEADVVFEIDEIKEILRSLDSFMIPTRKASDPSDANDVLRELLRNPRMILGWRGTAPASGTFVIDGVAGLFSRLIRYKFDQETNNFVQIDGSLSPYDFPNSVFAQITQLVKNRIFLAKAERLNLAESAVGTTKELAANAENLPQVLNLLQGSRGKYEEFLKLVNFIFPDIKLVTSNIVSSPPQAKTKILIWGQEAAEKDNKLPDRQDLAISLSESGTGVGQVLAMLYIIVSSEFPRIIVIDEPQTFLHPSAIRRLFSVFQDYSQHQYIISTHSPLAISSIAKQSILFLKKADSQTKVEIIDPTETEKLKNILLDIGVRLSDVFGTDRVLWVEGPTEERCFPLIIQNLVKERYPVASVIGVLSTSELIEDKDRKSARRALEIYERLTTKSSLLPVAIGFIFDQEGRSDTEIEDLERQSKDLMSFTSRKMYENYLLIPEAIIQIFKANGKDQNTVEDIQNEINNFLVQNKFVDGIETKDWKQKVHGANLLKYLFNKFAGDGNSYDKIRDGEFLTNYIIEHFPLELNDIREQIEICLKRGIN